MEEKPTNGLKEQAERRKRIDRMKRGIVLTISCWMIISMILCVVLLCRVVVLQHQVNDLKDVLSVTSVDGDVDVSISEAMADTQQSYDEPQSTGEIANAAENLAGEEDVHKVYLTFEDGPSSNTEEILDILAEYDVKATFFVVGKEDDTSKALYQRIVAEGHTLAMHSYSHKYSTIYNSVEDFSEDLLKLQDYLYDVTGVRCKYYRFPGGSANQVSNVDMSEFISYLNQQGLVYYDWNVSSGDAASQAYTPEELVDNVTADVVKYKTSVVLLHDSDTKTATVEALGDMIEALQAEGVELLPITDDTTVIQYIDASSVQ
ncbi:MAG: polysaccharide deacetylase family protein [Roseburia sp.]